MFGKKVIDKIDNEFGSFTVEELVYEGRRARVLFSGPMHSAQSGIPLDNDPHMLFDYNQRLLEMSIELTPRKILMLGGGTMTLPMALITALPEAELTVVELNAGMLTIASKYFGFKQQPRIRLLITDASKFMDQVEPAYDLIICDLYDNLTIPKVFRGVAFAEKLRRGLRPGGVVATNCISAISGELSQPMRQLCAAYSAGIGPVRIFKVDRHFAGWVPQNLIIVAAKSDNTISGLLRGCAEVPLP